MILDMGLEDSSLEEFSRAQLTWGNSVVVSGASYNASWIVSKLGPMLTPQRFKRIQEVVAQRTKHFVPVVEGIYDLGNIAAVMRSSESFGFISFRVISSPGMKFKAANRITRGAHRWLDVGVSSSAAETLRELKRRGYQVLATHLDAAKSLGEVDFSVPTAICFGNEKDGVSPELLSEVDGRVKIPMFGFSQSFNISVAAAITCYQARAEIERLGQDRFRLTKDEETAITAQYILRGMDNPEAVLQRVATQGSD